MPQQRVVTPAADFLADAGKFLYGKSDWLGPFAADLGVKPVMLHNWLKGRGKLLGNHPVLKRALRLVEERLDQQRDGWRAKCEEIEEAAMPDAPANDAGFPPKVAGYDVGDVVRIPIDGPPTKPATFVVTKVGPARMDVAPAKVRRHK